MEKNERLPIPNEKISIFRRIYNKLFYKKPEESEISKIAEKLSLEREQEPIENSEAGFEPDKRTVVYDFFKDISNYGGLGLWGTKQTIQFINSEGHERSFDIGVNEYGIGKIEIGESRIRTYDLTYGDYYGNSSYCARDAITEYLRLIKYDQFINSETGDKTFINELRQEIERASRGYDPNSTYEANKAGKRLDKALLKNPIYKQIKTSFNKAYNEYEKTFQEFRQNEANRRDSFNKKNGFREELKVEDIPEIKQDDKVESREKEEVERED